MLPLGTCWMGMELSQECTRAGTAFLSLVCVEVLLHYFMVLLLPEVWTITRGRRGIEQRSQSSVEGALAHGVMPALGALD